MCMFWNSPLKAFLLETSKIYLQQLKKNGQSKKQRQKDCFDILTKAAFLKSLYDLP